MALPPMTPDQRAAALAAAAKARTERGLLKARLKRGDITLADALAEECAKGIKVISLLESLPGTGKKGAAELMAELGIAEGRKVSGLGRNQRAALEEKFAAADA